MTANAKQRRGAQGEDAASGEQPKLVERVLARPLIQRGIERKPGETVELRAHQVEWLEREGYFGEEAKP